MAKPNDEDLISAEDAGAVLGVGGRQVQNLIKRGLLPGRLVGGSYVIRRGDLKKVPAERKRGPKPKG